MPACASSLRSAAARYIFIPVTAKISTHPIFNVRDVTVEGAEYLEPDNICKIADIEYETNIFDVNLLSVSNKLENAFSAEKFTVFRRLPHTVVIEVHERKPVALLNIKKLVGIDSEGVPLPHIGAEMIDTLPIITGIKSVSSLSDSTVKERLRTGLRMLERISTDAPAVYKRISEVDVTNMVNMGINLVDNGLRVIIGNREWKHKIPNLERIINEVTWRRENVKSVDIRFGEKVIVTR